MAAFAPKASILSLILVVLTAMIGFGIFIPIFPFLALYLGATATQTTIAMGAYSFGQLIGAPGWGRLSDTIGRKPVLIIGLTGAAVSYIMLAHAFSVETMGLARLFGGLMAGNVGAAFAAATDLADDKTRTRNMGFLGAAFALGFIFGPAIGAFLVGEAPNVESYRRVCYAAAGFATLAVVVAAFGFKETLPAHARRPAEAPRVSRRQILRDRPFLARLLIIMLLMISAQALLESTFGLWGDRELSWGPRETGFAFAALGLMTVAVQGGASGALAKLLGERRMLASGLAIFAIGFGVLAVAQAPAHAFLALTALAIGGSMATASLNSLVGAQTTEHDRGIVMGMNQSASALGRVIGPLFAGAIFDGMGHPMPFAIGAAVMAGALVLALGAAPKTATP